MRKLLPRALPRISLAFLIGITGPALFSCGGPLFGAERGPFGLEARAFSGMVARGDKRAFLALEPGALADPGPRGGATWFQAAFWLETGGFEGEPEEVALWRARILDLYSRAVAGSRGLLREFSLARLATLRGETARAAQAGSEAARLAWQELLALPAPGEGAPVADRSVDRAALRLEALAGLERYAELLGEAENLARGDLGASARLDGPVLYALALARKRLGMEGYGSALATLLSLEGGTWLAKGIALASEEAPGPDAEEGADPLLLATARLRAAVDARDYAAAYRLSKAAAPALRGMGADRNLVAVFARAYLFSGMSREGLALMDGIGAVRGTAAPAGSTAWTAAFYKARMLRSLARHDEAAAIFAALRPSTVDPRDRDATLWYELDSRFQALDVALGPAKDWVSVPARDLLLSGTKIELLAGASTLWDDPQAFEDLANALLRQLLIDRDWRHVEEFGLRLAGAFGGELAARSLYLAGRARELGLVAEAPPPPRRAPNPPSTQPAPEAGPARTRDGLLAAARYRSVLALPAIGDYYRLVSASRLGRDLAPPTGPPPDRASARSPWTREEREASRDFADLLGGLIDAGLAELVDDLAKERYDRLAEPELLDLAAASARAGSPYAAMRFANALSLRGAATRKVLLWLYPRPWLGEFRMALGDSGLPEALALGMVRSESWFDPGVTSRAGAVGLSQLMPATAAEIAAKLRLEAYSLTDPADNLRLGLRMFRDLMVENQGHSLRALFAYNAGRTRLKRWLAEAGTLPDDLLLETLTIDETRQYGRNIVVATAWYGVLHYQRGSAATVEELFAGIGVSGK